METYCILMNFRPGEPSSFGVEEAEKNEARFLKAIEAVGGKPVAYYTLLGRYDALTILEVPDGKAIASLMSAMKMAEPNVNTETMRAFTPEEYSDVMQSVGSLFKEFS